MPENLSKTDLINQLRGARERGKRPVAPHADLSGADLYGADLYGADLSGADLSGADLAGANLCGADLPGANLSGANLHGANLHGANLHGANLHGADLHRADLSWANLHGANLHRAAISARILHLHGLPSGETIFIPTPQGWHLRVGCWDGTLDEFKALISQDEGWPEARGDEVTRRRPSLQAVAALCEAHMALHPNIIGDLAGKWEVA